MKLPKYASNALVLLIPARPIVSENSTERHPIILDSEYDLQSALFPPSLFYASGFSTTSDVSVPGIIPLILDNEVLNLVFFDTNVVPVTHVGTIAFKTTFASTFRAQESLNSRVERRYKPSAQPVGGIGSYRRDSGLTARASGVSQNDTPKSYVVLGYRQHARDLKPKSKPKPAGGFATFYVRAPSDLQNELRGNGLKGTSEVLVSCSVMFEKSWVWDMGNGLDALIDEDNSARQHVAGTVLDNCHSYLTGGGQYAFPAGKWVTIAQRTKYNDPNIHNGEIQLWINGNSVLNISDISIENSTDSFVQGIQFGSYFGQGTRNCRPQTKFSRYGLLTFLEPLLPQ